MRKPIFILTALFLMLFAVPVMADVTIDYNGRYFNNESGSVSRNNYTMVPAGMIAQTLGAELTVNGDKIVLKENDATIEMTVGETKSIVNGQELSAQVAPEFIKGEVWLPLRFIYESLGAKVEWSAMDQMIKIEYLETRNNMDALQMLAKTSKMMQDANSYKMVVDTTMDMNMSVPDENNPELQQEIASQATAQIEAYVQYDPILMYIIENININSENPELQEATPQDISVEILLNDKGMYMNMPGMGWVKNELSGLDMQTLMEQSMAQDPLVSIETMKNLGMAISYNNDVEIDGQKYWVIDVAMGKDAMQKYLNQVQQQLTELQQSPDINNIFDNMDMEMEYRILINQDTEQIENMKLKTAFSLDVKVPEEGKNTNVKMDVDMEADYHISDYGLSFESPDVNEAKTLEEIMEQTELTQEPVQND